MSGYGRYNRFGSGTGYNSPSGYGYNTGYNTGYNGGFGNQGYSGFSGSGFPSQNYPSTQEFGGGGGYNSSYGYSGNQDYQPSWNERFPQWQGGSPQETGGYQEWNPQEWASPNTLLEIALSGTQDMSTSPSYSGLQEYTGGSSWQPTNYENSTGGYDSPSYENQDYSTQLDAISDILNGNTRYQPSQNQPWM